MAGKSITKNQYLVKGNGTQRIYVDRMDKNRMTLAVEWLGEVPPAGVLTFSVEGDPGLNNVKDLSEERRVWMTNGRPPFFDLDVTGLPDGGKFNLYLW